MFKKYSRKHDESPEDSIEIKKNPDENIALLNRVFSDCPDIIRKTIETSDGRRAVLVYVSSLADFDLVQRDVVAPLLTLKSSELTKNWADCLPRVLKTKYINKIESVVDEVLNGNTVVMLDGTDFGVSCHLIKHEKRSIEEPDTETVIKGSHEGFTEVLSDNLSMLRRKIKSSKLKFKIFQIGKRSHQMVVLAYLDDLVDHELLKKMSERIETIEYDNFPGIGYIEQMTADNRLTPFPQYHMTERPDKLAANLMEGRIAILMECTPVCLSVPVNFFQFFQSVDDYNINWAFGSFLRLLRLAAVIVAVYFPALYISILTYNYQAIPLSMLIPLAESRSRVPFPPIIEALVMELSFELIREASIRLPKNLAPTIGIVGGIVIGQAAVEAGIVSNVMVIIVGITAIATFIVPTFDMGLLLRLSRFSAMLFSAFFGIVGVMTFVMLTFAHLVTLESLGQPYLQPLTPYKSGEMKDTFIRAPFMFLGKRPDVAHPKDKTRGRTRVGKK